MKPKEIFSSENLEGTLLYLVLRIKLLQWGFVCMVVLLIALMMSSIALLFFIPAFVIIGIGENIMLRKANKKPVKVEEEIKDD